MSNFFMAVLAFLVTHSTAVVLAILGLILVVAKVAAIRVMFGGGKVAAAGPTPAGKKGQRTVVEEVEFWMRTAFGNASRFKKRDRVLKLVGILAGALTPAITTILTLSHVPAVGVTIVTSITTALMGVCAALWALLKPGEAYISAHETALAFERELEAYRHRGGEYRGLSDQDAHQRLVDQYLALKAADSAKWKQVATAQVAAVAPQAPAAPPAANK